MRILETSPTFIKIGEVTGDDRVALENMAVSLKFKAPTAPPRSSVTFISPDVVWIYRPVLPLAIQYLSQMGMESHPRVALLKEAACR